MSEKRKRITVKLKTPNPLFEKWIIEWRDKAKEQNSKMEFCFNKALESLRKYPLPMESGKECKILKGFGDKICQMLDHKLNEHKKNTGSSFDDTIIGNHNIKNVEDKPPKIRKPSKPVQNKSLRQNSSSKNYIPKENSGGYAILVTLYKKGFEPSYPGHLTKLEIIKAAQPLSDTSFTRPTPGTRYTAWSSMKTLISKQLVQKKSNPPKFSLTDEGLLLAKKLYDEMNNRDLCNNTHDSTNFCNGANKLPNTASNVIHIDENNVHIQTTSEVVSRLENGTEDHGIVTESISNKTTKTVYSSPSNKVATEENGIYLLDEVMQEDQTITSSTLSLKSSKGNTENIVVSRPQDSKTLQKHASISSVASSTQSCTQEETVIFAPDTFEIILYVDTCETGGSNIDIQDDPILAELKRLAVPFEVVINLQKMNWCCLTSLKEKEWMILEEALKMDVITSKKFRLKRSGIQNIIYLIEKYGKNEHVGLPVSSLYQAATNTAVQDGFCVTFTENCRDTAKYLATFSEQLRNMFKAKTLVSSPKENLSELSLDDELLFLMTFKEFNKTSSKNKPLMVSDLFVKMLVQIKGMSVEKALAIVGKYPTPTALKKAYDENPGKKGEKLLAQIEFGDGKKSIGQVLSKTVHQLFTEQHFNI
ncbi:hypothetical protein NQ318_021378 [Aromia moschata]|uniref:Crossover junction endonuclease MUS81 n=1 Tax=Aromia moschata TaxID=1265417 RepID=A0AAV8ZC96_9CUCU|nr:hypothetical protein NQ318_021378 [Aromia moschata]